MKRIFINVVTLFLFLYCQVNFAGTGLFIKLSTAGSILNLTTVKPNHDYPDAGIKFEMPGYTVLSCRKSNEYCLFDVSDTSPASLIINGPAGIVKAISCLQAKEPVTVSIINFRWHRYTVLLIGDDSFQTLHHAVLILSQDFCRIQYCVDGFSFGYCF